MVIGSIVSSASPHWMLAVEVSRKQCHAKSNRSASRARNKGAALLGGHLDADQRALQRDVGGSQSIFGSLAASRFSARASASLARCTSISSARSAVSARTVTRSGRTSANPERCRERGFLPAHVVITQFTNPSSVISGACPGKTPNTVFAGICCRPPCREAIASPA